MPPSPIQRLLAFTLGGIAALGLIVVTFGLALAAPIGMGITAVMRRSRGRPVTRLASWFGASVAVAVGVALLMIVGIASSSESLMEAMRQSAELESTREPTSFERAIERMAPRTPASAEMEQRVEAWTTSETFMWTSVMLGGALSSALIGLLVGSAGWACTMLLLFGARGRWPATPEIRASAAQ